MTIKDFLTQSFEENKLYLKKVEQAGDIQKARQFYLEWLRFNTQEKNAKELNLILTLIEPNKRLRGEYHFYKLCYDGITANFSLANWSNLRDYLIESLAHHNLLNYRKRLTELQGYFSGDNELLINEKQILTFFEEIKKLDFSNRDYYFEPSWLIKQLMLFPTSSSLFNGILLLFFKNKSLSLARDTYNYILERNIDLWSENLAYIHDQSWEKENQYKLKKTLSSSGNLGRKKIKKNIVDENFIQKVLKQSIVSKKSNVISNKREEFKEELQDIRNREIKNNIIISFGKKEPTQRAIFYLENGLFKELYALSQQQLTQTQEDDLDNQLRWQHFAMLSLQEQREYQKAQEKMIKTHLKLWLAHKTQALDLLYLTAENFFRLAELDKACYYYELVDKINAGYRLTKVRLEEIKDNQ